MPRRRPLHATLPALLLLLLTTMSACPDEVVDPGADVGDSADTADSTDAAADGPAGDADPWAGKSYYRIVIDTDSADPITVERDITDKLSNFSFGSTHIAPAVSLAVSDVISWPATLTITFNFGIVLGSDTYPIQCDKAGEYAFGGAPPEIDITKSLRYVSSVPGSTGSIKITSWTRTTGEVFKGTFQGRIRQLTEKVEKRWADVEGEFQFILPEPADGQ